MNKSLESRNKIKGKDVILVLGQTGSGKTTLILRLLGYNFRAEKREKCVEYVPAENIKPEHRMF